MPSSSSDDAADLVRILGRTILVVNVVVGALIFLLAGPGRGPATSPNALGIAVAFIVSGPFAWAVLRALAQIRDRVEKLGNDS